MMNKYLVQDYDDITIKVFNDEWDAQRYIRNHDDGTLHIFKDRVLGL